MIIDFRFARQADLGRRKMLRDAQMAASVKLRRGVVIQHQGRLWAVRVGQRTLAAGRAKGCSADQAAIERSASLGARPTVSLTAEVVRDHVQNKGSLTGQARISGARGRSG